jgi:hypothetical protein
VPFPAVSCDDEKAAPYRIGRTKASRIAFAEGLDPGAATVRPLGPDVTEPPRVGGEPDGYTAAVSVQVRVCSACGHPATPTARFCSQCGRELLGANEQRRVYGVLSPGPVFVLGCVLLLAALLALVAGSVIAAIVFLALAGGAFAFFYDAARRDPASPVAHRVTTSGRHVRGWMRFIRESGSAWADAIRAVVRIRGESRALRREREQAVRSLGDAAYRDDEPAVTALRTRLREIDDGLAERDRERAETVSSARRHVEEERAAARPTEQYSVDELTSGE